jgi:hypothetical protein
MKSALDVTYSFAHIHTRVNAVQVSDQCRVMRFS